MLDMKYSLLIEATDDLNSFGFYSPDLEGFTGVGNSIEDCLYKAKWGMEEHVALLRVHGLPVPAPLGEPNFPFKTPDLCLLKPWVVHLT